VRARDTVLMCVLLCIQGVATGKWMDMVAAGHQEPENVVPGGVPDSVVSTDHTAAASPPAGCRCVRL
jgi:hypothetical protein